MIKQSMWIFLFLLTESLDKFLLLGSDTIFSNGTDLIAAGDVGNATINAGSNDPIEWLADESLERGDCYVETHDSRVDARWRERASAVVVAGTTVTSQPASTRQRRMLRLAPRSIATTWRDLGLRAPGAQTPSDSSKR